MHVEDDFDYEYQTDSEHYPESYHSSSPSESVSSEGSDTFPNNSDTDNIEENNDNLEADLDHFFNDVQQINTWVDYIEHSPITSNDECINMGRQTKEGKDTAVSATRKRVKMTDLGYSQSTLASQTMASDTMQDEYVNYALKLTKRKKPGVRGRPKKIDAGLGPSKTPTLPSEASRRMGQANAAFVQREYREALEHLQQVIRWSPGAPEAYHTAAMCHEEQGNIEKACNYYLLAAHLDSDNTDRWVKIAELLEELRREKGDPHGSYRQQCIYALSRAIKTTLRSKQEENELWMGDPWQHPILSMMWERARMWVELQNPLRAIQSFVFVVGNLSMLKPFFAMDPTKAIVDRLMLLGTTLPMVKQVTALILTKKCLAIDYEMVNQLLSFWMRRDVVDEVMHGLTGDRASPTRVHPRVRVIDYLNKHAVTLVEKLKVEQSKILEYTEHALKRGTDWWLLTDERRAERAILALPLSIRIRLLMARIDENGSDAHCGYEDAIKEVLRMIDLLTTKFPRQVNLLGDLLDQVADFLVSLGHVEHGMRMSRLAGTSASHVRIARLMRASGHIDEAIAELKHIVVKDGLALLSELYRESGQEEASISTLKQLEGHNQFDRLYELFPGLETVAFEDLLGDPKRDSKSKFVEGTNILRFGFGFARPKEKRTISGAKRKKTRGKKRRKQQQSTVLDLGYLQQYGASNAPIMASEGLFRHAMYLVNDQPGAFLEMAIPPILKLLRDHHANLFLIDCPRWMKVKR